jgi:hypothetical protein
VQQLLFCVPSITPQPQLCALGPVYEQVSQAQLHNMVLWGRRAHRLLVEQLEDLVIGPRLLDGDQRPQADQLQRHPVLLHLHGTKRSCLGNHAHGLHRSTQFLRVALCSATAMQLQRHIPFPGVLCHRNSHFEQQCQPLVLGVEQRTSRPLWNVCRQHVCLLTSASQVSFRLVSAAPLVGARRPRSAVTLPSSRFTSCNTYAQS